MTQNIYAFVKTEENSYQTLPTPVIEGYEWKMVDHIKKTIFYKNSQFMTGSNESKPFKNIIRPILNLQYSAEGFDVKDILLYINDAYKYFKSFLVKKFHEKWARENKIDTFIDELVESYVDFGGALVKDTGEIKPEIVPLQRIAFCDQTDILSGPIAEKHYFSVEQLRDMADKGWGDTKKGATGTIEELIKLCEDYKKEPSNSPGKVARTPSKYIEIYEVHGTFPDWWLEGNENYEPSEEENFIPQIHICSFYKNQNDEKVGFTLFKSKENKQIYKFLSRDKIYGRALGLGGAEELFQPQIWINYDMIRIKEMLDAASKVILQTASPTIAGKQNLQNVDNLQILEHEEGKPLSQVDTLPRSMGLFERSTREWEDNARLIGAATESILGEQPSAGTPFKLQELITAESHSLHEYRKGKLAIFLDEIYQDWIIPKIAKEITKKQEFLANLDLSELQAIADNLVILESNKLIKERILSGELTSNEEIEQYKVQVREEFMKKGNKRFIQILEGELKDLPISVEINIAGKQKYLASMTDKLVNVLR